MESAVSLVGGFILILAIPFLIGLIILQIFLCKRSRGRVLGLILPLVFSGFSFLCIMCSLFMVGSSNLRFLIMLLLFNLPTIVLWILYFALRNSKNKEMQKKQLNRMNIQDLD